MKKLIGIFLAALLILSFVACDEQGTDDPHDGGASSVTTTAPDPTGDPTGTTAGGDTTVGDTTAGTSQTDPPADNNDEEKIKTDVLHWDYYYEFLWEETDGANGLLTISQYMIAPADEMESMGLSGELIFKDEIITYNVTYVKSADGVYVAEGTIVSVAAAAEGESAADFIKIMKNSLGDSQLDVLTGRVLDGEVLTSKEDIENYIWEFDNSVKVTFTVTDGKMTVSEYEKNYVSWGFEAPTKEVCHIEDSVVRTFDEYERGELSRVSTYRENGIIEKRDNYYEGEVSHTDYYDENGEIIENND